MLKGKYDEKIDIWGLGICCYILHFGTPPFKGPTNSDIFDSISRAKSYLTRLDDWRGASPLFKDFIRKTLDTNPQNRPSAIELI